MICVLSTPRDLEVVVMETLTIFCVYLYMECGETLTVCVPSTSLGVVWYTHYNHFVCYTHS